MIDQNTATGQSVNQSATSVAGSLSDSALSENPLSDTHHKPQHWLEWQRVELLCLCLIQSKDGPPENLINDLKISQSKIEQFRQTDWWSQLSIALSHFSLDVLCCIFAPQVVARVGWFYQELQASRATLSSEGLIASLLAVPDSELDSLRNTLNDLAKNGLILREQNDPFAPIHPDKLALARLMGWTDQDYAPQGAHSVHSNATWSDLILPDEQQQMLQEFLYWIKYKRVVIDEWGGQPTGGPIALFTGPPGTGKTLAASVIANHLGWPLFRVDLSALVSKYIGETEKNIGRLFDATHGRKVFLQFDEVDALMGKRGELKEARDRYANMEVSYLLSRIEEHDGPCILTTNLRSQIDKAFCRRFQMVVEFSRPDLAQRIKLWRHLLPPKAPVADSLDFEQVAAAVNLTGGQIRNAALHAAYLAAADKQIINIHHIAVAVFRELSKTQAQVNHNQLGGLANYLVKTEENRAKVKGEL